MFGEMFVFQYAPWLGLEGVKAGHGLHIDTN